MIREKFVIVPIDKAGNNISLICKAFYVERTLKEVGIMGDKNATYKILDKHPEEIIFNDQEISRSLNIEGETQNNLPIIYWTPKMHKNPIGARFIIASKNSSNKPISKAITKVFKLFYNQIESFNDKSRFYSNYNLFWITQNSTSITEMLDKINKHKKAKSIATYDFSTLYTNIRHDDLIS